ncbi:MAG: flagellar protein FlgN [Xanthomonadaceae bacterium]|nr:flagellar protein FlgN [Xanthomonadaceae bacterium]
MSRQLQHELGNALSAVIGDMQQAVRQLAQLLEAERTALDTNNIEALDRAGTQKQATMLQLEQLDAERLQLSRELPASAAALESNWALVVQSLRRCQQLNQSNGSMVNQRLNQVRQALSILTGHAGENSLYGRTGVLHANLRSQALAEA